MKGGTDPGSLALAAHGQRPKQHVVAALLQPDTPDEPVMVAGDEEGWLRLTQVLGRQVEAREKRADGTQVL